MKEKSGCLYSRDRKKAALEGIWGSEYITLAAPSHLPFISPMVWEKCCMFAFPNWQLSREIFGGWLICPCFMCQCPGLSSAAAALLPSSAWAPRIALCCCAEVAGGMCCPSHAPSLLPCLQKVPLASPARRAALPRTPSPRSDRCPRASSPRLLMQQGQGKWLCCSWSAALVEKACGCHTVSLGLWSRLPWYSVTRQEQEGGRRQDGVLLAGTPCRKLPMLSPCLAVLMCAPLKAHLGQNMSIFQISAWAGHTSSAGIFDSCIYLGGGCTPTSSICYCVNHFTFTCEGKHGQVPGDWTVRGVMQIKASESIFWANKDMFSHRRPCSLGQVATNSSTIQGHCNRHLWVRPRHAPLLLVGPAWPCSPSSRVWQLHPNTKLFAGDQRDCWGLNLLQARWRPVSPRWASSKEDKTAQFDPHNYFFLFIY